MGEGHVNKISDFLFLKALHSPFKEISTILTMYYTYLRDTCTVVYRESVIMNTRKIKSISVLQVNGRFLREQLFDAHPCP
jgi:hypothetical protein